MKIFAVIVTYNGTQHDWIEKCLTSLEQSTMPVTAIVVDNNSTDSTREYVPKHFPNAVWFPQEKNLGFGQANNIGIRYALENGADYILLLNQDATIHPDALKLLTEASDRESLLSPVHLNGDGTKLDEMFRISIKPKDGMLFSDLLLNKKLEKSYETGEICAACWLLPANVVRNIGGFNPLFFHYGEDNNYYQRLVYHKVKTLLVPQATMCHDRIFYGNEVAFNKNKYRRDVLLIVLNINYSIGNILFQLVRLLLRTYSYNFRNYRIGTFSFEMLWLMSHLRTILNARNTDKSTGSSWLK